MIREKYTPTKFYCSLFSMMLFLGISTSLFAQNTDSAFVLLKNIPVSAKSFTTDKLKQVYLVNLQNELIKYNSNAEEVFRFNNNTLGTLDFVDVTNPFNILLYYPEFRTVITLDRTLSKTGEFDLFDLDVEEVKTVASSNDNNIWLYDDVAFKVKKINKQGKVLIESDNLSLLLGYTISPNFILEKENNLYVNAPNHGILIFDIFGRYQNTLTIKNVDRFQIEDGRLIYYQEGRLISFHLRSLNIKSFAVPGLAQSTAAIRIHRERLYVMRVDKIDIYSF